MHQGSRVRFDGMCARTPAACWVLLCALLFCSGPLQAGTPVNWTGNTGSWNDPARWSLNLVPNNSGGSTYDVTIGSASADVSLNISATVDTLANSGTLRLQSGFTLSLAQAAGLTNAGQILVNHTGTSGLAGRLNNTGFMWVQGGALELSSSSLQNDGTIWLGDGSSSGTAAVLRATSDWNWNGNGEIYFFSTATNEANQPKIDIGAGRRVTNGAAQRIHGGAGIISGAGEVINQGIIDADVPLRTLKLSLGQFTNQGNLWARSGNLNVAVDDWHNSGTVRVSNGGQSLFTGSLLTNDAGATLESLGGATLQLSQNVINQGSINTGGSGRIAFSGANTLITNLPNGKINATSGVVRFDGPNSYVQNFGGIRANQGSIEWANGADVFGGIIALAASSSMNVQVGTTTLAETRTTIDSTSSIDVQDLGGGPVNLQHTGVLENNGGRLLAQSAGGNTATISLSGLYKGTNGTFRSDGGDINLSNTNFQQAGTLLLEIKNAGDIRFSNVDSNAALMRPNWSGVGGILSFDNYRASVPTNLDLSGWTATNGTFTVANGTSVTASGLASLPVGTQLAVSGAGARLSMPALTLAATGSLVDVAFGGRLAANNLNVDGELRLRGGTFEGNINLNPSAVFNAINNGANLITGSLSWSGNREIVINSSNLGINGPVSVAAGSGMTVSGAGSRLNGSGLITNSGLILGQGTSNQTSNYLDSPLVNTAAGTVRATSLAPATNTYFQLSGNITNAGLMEADSGNLYFTGSTAQNSGTIRATNNPAGSRVIFITGSKLANSGGSTIIDGAASTLEAYQASQVQVGNLSFLNGSTGIIGDAGTSVTASNTVNLGTGSKMTVYNSSQFNAAGLNLTGGELLVQNSAVINSPVTVQPTGKITANSALATLNGSVSILGSGPDLGRLSLVTNGAQVNGTGTITNSGLIEGGAPSTNNSTYLDSTVINNAAGTIRAFQNGAATSTYLQLRGSVTNAGVMEANGGNLYFTAATAQNSGTIRAINNPAGSKVIFLNSSKLANSGGTTTIDGAASTFEAYQSSQLQVGNLSFTNGAIGIIGDNTTSVTATNTVNLGTASKMTVYNSSQFTAAGLNLNGGELVVQNSAAINAPITVQPNGKITANSSVATLNGNTSILAVGPNQGRLSLTANSSQVNGTGVITNSGLIEGGAFNTNNSTYLDNTVINNSTGIIRAFQNNSATNTFFQLRSNVTNAGTLEANGANLYFPGTTLQNSGTIRAVNNPGGASKLIFLGSANVTNSGGTTSIDGAASTLEVSQNSKVQLGTLSFANGAGGFTSDGGTVLTAVNSVDLGLNSTFTVTNSSQFNAAGFNLNGSNLIVQNSATVNAPITIQPTGKITANSSTATLNGNINILNDGGSGKGRISLTNNNSVVNGTGTITNSGLIEGGAPNDNNSVFLDKAVNNTSSGTIRAFKNGAANNTYLQVRGNVTNTGIMEADGGNLYFIANAGPQGVTNSGTVRGVNNSQVIFTNGARMTDAGGIFRLSSGATGQVVNGGTSVDASTMVDAGTTLSVQNSARLGGPSALINGTLVVEGSALVDAPITLSPTGLLKADSGIATLNKSVNVQAIGPNIGKISIVNNSSRINGAGLITNSGIIEGGALNNGNPTYLDNSLVNNASGVVRAFSNNGATNTTFQLAGSSITNQGLITANAATLSVVNSFVDSTGGSWTASNNGHLQFNASSFSGSGATSSIDGDTSSFDLVGNALVGLSSLSLTNGGDFSVNGGATSLAVGAGLTMGSNSVGTIVNGGRLTAPSINLAGGSLAAQGGTVYSNVQVGAAGAINATTASTLFDGDITTVSGATIAITNGGTGLVVNGALNNVAGATVRVNTNTTGLAGTGLFTNAGILQGGGFNNNNTATLSKNLVNSGQLSATAASGATGTSFQITSPLVTNTGTMTATGAHLTFTGSNVDNSGTLRAENGFALTFQNGAKLNNLGGGGAQVDGDSSMLRVLGGTTVALNSMSLTAGGDTLVQGNLQVAQPFTVGTSSVLTVQSGGVLGGGAVQVNGTLSAGQSSIGTPVTIGATGLLSITSASAATFDAPVTVQSSGPNVGKIQLLGNGFNMAGAGQVTNNGTIEGDGGGAAAGTFFLSNNLTNNVAGKVRAFHSAGANNPTFRLTGLSITNSGTFEADQGNISIGPSGMTNNGTIRTLNGGGFNSDGPVTSNDGSTISFAAASGTLRFQSNLNSSGILEINANTLRVDGNLVFGTNARFHSSVGSTLQLGGDFQNASTFDNDFASGSTLVQLSRSIVNFEAGSQDVGGVLTGFTDNFGIRQLVATNTVSSIQLTDLFDNQANGANNDALYINTLTLQNLNSKFFLNGHTVYYGTFNGQISQIVLGGGSFIQVAGAGVPEPATLVLSVLAGVVLTLRRRGREGRAAP